MARRLVQRFQENGVTKDKIVVSIPATEEGVHATRSLAKEDGILVNLAMVAGMSHAAVCAEAGAAWITFHLDRVSVPARCTVLVELMPRGGDVVGKGV
jgi:transaldolase